MSFLIQFITLAFWLPRFSMPGDRLDRLLCQNGSHNAWQSELLPGVQEVAEKIKHPYPRRIQLYDNHWISNRFVSAIFLFFSVCCWNRIQRCGFFPFGRRAKLSEGRQSKTKRIWLFSVYIYKSYIYYNMYIYIYPLKTFLKQLLALLHTEGLGVTHWDSDVHSFTVWELNANLLQRKIHLLSHNKMRLGMSTAGWLPWALSLSSSLSPWVPSWMLSSSPPSSCISRSCCFNHIGEYLWPVNWKSGVKGKDVLIPNNFIHHKIWCHNSPAQKSWINPQPTSSYS